MCRKTGFCGGAEHRGRVPEGQPEIERNVKFQTSVLAKYCATAVQSLVRLRVDHKIWCHLMPKPRHLAFGILAGVVDARSDAPLRAAARPGNGGRAQARHAPSGRASAGSGARSNTGRDLGQHALRRAWRRSGARSGPQPAALGRQQDAWRSARAPAAPASACQSLSGRPVADQHLPGADMALAVAGLQPRRRSPDRARPGARGKRRRPAPASRHWPARGSPGGTSGMAAMPCIRVAQIEARAAAQDRRAARRQAALDLRRGERRASAPPTGSR